MLSKIRETALFTIVSKTNKVFNLRISEVNNLYGELENTEEKS